MTMHSGEAVYITIAMVPHQDIIPIYFFVDKWTVNVGGETLRRLTYGHESLCKSVHLGLAT